MAAVAQRSMPLQTGTAQICARPDPFQQALIVCPPGFQGKPPPGPPPALRLRGPATPTSRPKALFGSSRGSGIAEPEAHVLLGLPGNNGTLFFSPPASDVCPWPAVCEYAHCWAPIVMPVSALGPSHEIPSVWLIYGKVPVPDCQQGPGSHEE